MTTLDHCMERLGYRFQDPSLLEMALTHTSFVAKGRDETSSYERLEFVGDRVIGLVIAEKLFEKFDQAVAGEMNRRLSALVRRETLAEVASSLGVGQFILMSPGEEDAGGREKPAILADVMEAILGAMFLDGGLDVVRPFVLAHWSQRIEESKTAQRDPKSALQEWSQANGFGLPEYAIVSQTGADHSPEFVVSCCVNHKTCEAKGPSKRKAERLAAQNWLSTFVTNSSHADGSHKE